MASSYDHSDKNGEVAPKAPSFRAPDVKNSALKLALVTCALLTLSACKSDKLPTFPTNSPPPAIPIPSSGGIPSPPSGPSLPTPPSGQPSPPSSPGSSGGSSGTSAPSLPSPGLPDLGSKPSGGGSSGDVAKSGKKSGKQGSQPGGQQGSQQGQSGQQGETGGEPGSPRENRTAAGDELQKAGERIAKAGTGEIDPLIPQTNSDSDADGDIFADGTSTPNSNPDETGDLAGNGVGQADSEQTGNTGAASGSADVEAGSAGDVAANGESSAEGQTQAGADLPPGLAEDILAAQQAMEQAGIALQEAGAAVANAETDEELQAAEDLLGDARIAVIVATQGVETIEADLAEMPDFGTADGDVFTDTSAALQDANIALVIATREVLIARTGSPEFPEGGGAAGGTGNGQVAALEDELDESLVIFDGQIGDAREAVLAKSTPPETAGSGRGSPGIADAPIPLEEQGQLMELPEESSEDTPEEQTVASAPMPDLNQGDIPDPQGDDIVAQQLREAAQAESDPELQAKLWEEYKRYKEGL